MDTSTNVGEVMADATDTLAKVDRTVHLALGVAALIGILGTILTVYLSGKFESRESADKAHTALRDESHESMVEIRTELHEINVYLRERR